MAERDQIGKEKVEHSGLFDFPGLYSFAHSWFMNEEYGVNEERYSEKVSGEKRDIKIEWKATKKISDYFKIEFKVVFEISEMEEVKVEIEGKQGKMNKGKISIDVTAVLIKDHENKWDTTPFNRFLRDVYNKFIIPSRINSVETLVFQKMVRFKEDIKAFLELTGRR